MFRIMQTRLLNSSFWSVRKRRVNKYSKYTQINLQEAIATTTITMAYSHGPIV